MRTSHVSGEAGLGRMLFATALFGFGVENVLFGHYVVARAVPWPDEPSSQFVVACLTAAVFLASGAAMLTGRFLRAAGVTSAAVIMWWMVMLRLPAAMFGPAWSGDWTNVLKAATFAAGAIGVAVSDGRPTGPGLKVLRTIAPCVASLFFLLCGIQHFMFAGFVQTLVPRFIPAPYFWTYFAGVALIAAGIGFCVPPIRRVTAVVTAAMVFSWVFLVHIPLVFTNGRVEWMGVVEALGISGVCLILASRPTSDAALPATSSRLRSNAIADNAVR
jgi:uncharacterized membrane protein YphA (DoxX/SURF4 family)